LGLDKFLIVRCPECGNTTFYSPRKKAKRHRHRRRCPYCGYRYEVNKNTIIGGPVNSKEAQYIIKKINEQNIFSKRPHSDQIKPMFEKIRADFKKILNTTAKNLHQTNQKDKNFIFFSKRPKNGPTPNPPRPKAQKMRGSEAKFSAEEIGLEIDRAHFHGRFEKPDVFIKLGGNPMEGRIEKDLGFGTIYIYTTGVFDAYIDMSDPMNRRLLEGILRAIEVETGINIVNIEYIDGEATVKIPRYDELGEKIAKTIGPRTKLMWIDYIPKIKLYLESGKVDPNYRIESTNFEPLYNTVQQFTQEQLHIEKSMPVFLIVSDVNQQQLLQIQQQVEQIRKENVAITATLNQLTTLIMNHDERMMQEHQLIMQQNRAILEKMERIAEARSNIEERIINLLQEPKTVNEIASEIGLSYSATYYHLKKLEERGIIQAQQIRTGQRGRPKTRYGVVR